MSSQAFRIQIAEPAAVRAVEAATPELEHFFELMKQGVAAIPGATAEDTYGAVTLRALGLRPDLLADWLRTEYHALKQGAVPPRIKELLAMAIAQRNEGEQCVACAPYHAGAARAEGASQAEIDAALQNVPTDSPDLLAAVLDFGLCCAFEPGAVSDAQIRRLRELGCDDAALVELISASLVAYSLSAVNRILNLRAG